MSQAATAPTGAAQLPKKTVKKAVGLFVGIAILVAGMLIPGSPELSHEAIMSLAILFFAVAFWICDTLPMGVTGLLGAVMLPLFGVVPDFATAFNGFTVGTTWFIFGVFVLTAIMLKSTLGRRLVAWMVKRVGTKPKSIVLAYILASTIISMFISDTAAAAVGMAIALPFLKAIDAKERKRNLGRCVLMGISFAAIIGGFITPFGASGNIMCAGFLTAATGDTINFFQWFIPGLAVAVVMTPIMWVMLCRFFPPEELTEDDLAYVQNKDAEPMSLLDKKSLAFIIVIVAGFIAGSWIPVLSNTNVVIIMLAIAFMPGVNILTWEEFEKAEGWNIVLQVGGVMSMANAAGATGAVAWIVGVLTASPIMAMPPLAIVMAVTALAYVLVTFVPAAPAIMALFTPPMIGVSIAAGISPAFIVLLLPLITAASYSIPLCPPVMLSYHEGYYSILDLNKVGIPYGIALVVVGTLVVYFIGGLVLPNSLG